MGSEPSDWKSQAYELYVARWAEEEAAQAERRRVDGKASIWLQRAADDAETFTRDQQDELATLVSVIRSEGVELEAPFMAMDAADAVGGYIGQLIIPIAQVAAPVITATLVGWLRGRSGRKVRVQFHPDGKLKDVEAQTSEQVVELIKVAHQEAESRASKKPKSK